MNGDSLVDFRDMREVQSRIGTDCVPQNPCPWDLTGDGDIQRDDLEIVVAAQDTCCEGDLDRDGIGGVGDLLLLLEAFGPCCPDLTGDAFVGFADLATLLAMWGPYAPCPPHILADFDQTCDVGFADLTFLLSNWGECTCP